MDAAVVLDRCTVAWQLLDDKAFCCVGNGQRADHIGVCKVDLEQTQICASVIFVAASIGIVDIYFTGNINMARIVNLYRALFNGLRLAVFTVCILHRVTVIVVNIVTDICRVDDTDPLHGGLCTIISRLTNCLFGKNI